MKMYLHVVPASLLIVALGAFAAAADDFDTAKLQNWHQWRGPLANGVAPEANPPREWSESKNVRWKVEIPGKGSGSPIVWNDRVFVLTAVPTARQGEASAGQSNDQQESQGRRRRGGFGRGPAPTTPYQFTLLCFDRNTGRELWRQVSAEEVPHEPGHPTNTFASSSATTDGRRLFVPFGSYGIFCYDLDGELQWKRDLGDMQTRNGFGEGASPALYEDTLIVPWDHEGQSFIAALDANTGETLWRQDRDELTTWATPLVVEHKGRVQVIANGSNRVRSYDLKSGAVIWECGGQASNPIPSPVVLDNLVYCMTGYRGYAVFAIPLDSKGDITGTDDVAWSRTDAGPYVSSPVLYGGQLYFTRSRDAVLLSLDAKTGEAVIDQTRLPGLNSMYASPVAAAGRIYFTSREGATIVLKPGAKLEVLATNRLDEGIDASPALAGKQMFLRGEKHLYCIEEGAVAE